MPNKTETPAPLPQLIIRFRDSSVNGKFRYGLYDTAEIFNGIQAIFFYWRTARHAVLCLEDPEVYKIIRHSNMSTKPSPLGQCVKGTVANVFHVWVVFVLAPRRSFKVHFHAFWCCCCVVVFVLFFAFSDSQCALLCVGLLSVVLSAFVLAPYSFIYARLCSLTEPTLAYVFII